MPSKDEPEQTFKTSHTHTASAVNRLNEATTLGYFLLMVLFSGLVFPPRRSAV